MIKTLHFFELSWLNSVISCVYIFFTVVSSSSDPFEGWIDNFNGPVGLMVAGGKGVVKVAYGHPESILDLIPVDVAIKIMLVSAWYAATCG